MTQNIIRSPESGQREPNQTSERKMFYLSFIYWENVSSVTYVRCKRMWIFAFSIWCDPFAAVTEGKVSGKFWSVLHNDMLEF